MTAEQVSSTGNALDELASSLGLPENWQQGLAELDESSLEDIEEASLPEEQRGWKKPELPSIAYVEGTREDNHRVNFQHSVDPARVAQIEAGYKVCVTGYTLHEILPKLDVLLGVDGVEITRLGFKGWGSATIESLLEQEEKNKRSFFYGDSRTLQVDIFNEPRARIDLPIDKILYYVSKYGNLKFGPEANESSREWPNFNEMAKLCQHESVLIGNMQMKRDYRGMTAQYLSDYRIKKMQKAEKDLEKKRTFEKTHQTELKYLDAANSWVIDAIREFIIDKANGRVSIRRGYSLETMNHIARSFKIRDEFRNSKVFVAFVKGLDFKQFPPKIRKCRRKMAMFLQAERKRLDAKP